ncbi:MAG TPA: glycosyltransferase family 2 protein, partial [Candidatus Thermoplasmatota archaeon]|nr:glycosyltransferase family 2 protein [Candidatus Thermoplasmatota archaeon]
FPGAPDEHKAGALRVGLARARGEAIALFDADFEPPPDFLRRALARLAPDVACVQARWTSANEGASWLTRAVALGLDAHFVVEQESRARQGSLLSFSGTACVWRREAIERSGGWSGRTLAEDVDLSARALLAGWRFVHLDELRVPQEVPSTMRAFRAQQARWARGSMQCARLHAGAALRARSLQPAVRAETLFHLTHYAVHPLLLALFLLQLAAPWTPRPPAALTIALFAPAILAPLALFALAAARGGGARRLASLPALALVGLGLSWSNTRAVALGLAGARGAFERTPKSGEPRRASGVPRPVELALGLAGVAGAALLAPAWWPAAACAAFGAGFLLVALWP